MYYNDRLHLITKVASNRAMMNASANEPMKKKVIKNILKKYKQRQYLRLILMTVMQESQIVLKISTKNMSYSFLKRIIKALYKVKMDCNWKSNIQQKELLFNIKTDDKIKHEKFANDS